MNDLPLTGLQYLVLSLILPCEKVGSDVRASLEVHGQKKDGAAFYQMMSRLESAGYVEGRYTQEIVEGQMHRERWYAATEQGAEAWVQTRDFYADLAKQTLRDGFPSTEGRPWTVRVTQPGISRSGQNPKPGP